jgi:hypothetical protein
MSLGIFMNNSQKHYLNHLKEKVVNYDISFSILAEVLTQLTKFLLTIESQIVLLIHEAKTTKG